MMPMTSQITWTDIALRLALTVVVGMVVGYNRSEHGEAAGMRTTVLVCLAASVAMIQVNLLLPMAGREPTSFVMNDLMRLPLGILTGVGFIGAGAILRRDNIVVGVTTAATLWVVTVIGLCIGGGQIALGLAGTILAFGALWALRALENWMPIEHQARFSIDVDAAGPTEAQIRRRLEQAGLSIIAVRSVLRRNGEHRELQFNVSQVRRFVNHETPALLGELAAASGVLKVEWDGLP